MIFVFGSNLAGLHGAGAAKFAEKYKGAVRGCGQGMYGNSYAIPTKDARIRQLPLSEIGLYVQNFIQFARMRNDLDFQVTAIGCGLAGYNHEQIAPLFRQAPDNCKFDEAWKSWLGFERNYWGTYENKGRGFTP